ncbi:hypothetical protein [Ekhidna sp.]|uniref:hypothetical protein n=1 Tax=Ekhidna sp. TaxID=2608089 RepID=UPI003CCBA4F0
MRNLFVIFLLFGSLASFSQIKDGAKVVDLSLSYTNSNGNTFFFAQPLIGFGVNENKLLYAGFAYSHQYFDFSGDTENLTSLIIGYEKLMELNSSVYFAPFFSGSYGIGKSDDGFTKEDINNLSLTFRPRIHYFMNSKWSLVASVGAVQLSNKVVEGATGKSTSNILSLNLNSSNVFFGIRLNLNND